MVYKEEFFLRQGESNIFDKEMQRLIERRSVTPKQLEIINKMLEGKFSINTLIVDFHNYFSSFYYKSEQLVGDLEKMLKRSREDLLRVSKENKEKVLQQIELRELFLAFALSCSPDQAALICHDLERVLEKIKK